MFVLCVLYSRDKRKSQDYQDKELRLEYKEITKRNPDGGEIFRTRQDRPWDPPNLLYDGYRVCFAGVKWPGRGVNHPLPSSAEVKERVELLLSVWASLAYSRADFPLLCWHCSVVWFIPHKQQRTATCVTYTCHVASTVQVLREVP